MEVSVLGVDLGKNSCSVVGLDATGRVVVRRRMRRESVITYAAALPPCVVAMDPAAVPITWAERWRDKAMPYD